MDTFEPPKYLMSLISAVNDGAKAAQTGAFAFALIGLYLMATAFSATDEDLLMDRTMAISQLGTQVPMMVSFAMMPIVFVMLHMFTLIRYDMLAANVHQFRVDLDQKVHRSVDRERCRHLLANVEFIQGLAAPPGSKLHSRLYGLVAWIVIAGFPVVVLLAVQTNALRYQSEVVTGVQRISLLADLAILFWFFNRQARRRTPNPDAPVAILQRWGRCTLLPTIVMAVNLVWLNIPVPIETSGSPHPLYSDTLTFNPLDRFLCPIFQWGCRFLRVDHRTLIGKVWDSKAIMELSAGQALTTDRQASFEGVFLRRRSFRFANISEVRLYDADMIGIDLRDATMIEVNLTGSKLTGAKLARADMSRGNLVEANLSGASLVKGNLTEANLSRANLINVDLTEANLGRARLVKGNLTNANLNRASLTNVDLTEANLSGASLIKVDLTNANLSRTNLNQANLFNATLINANLVGANLARANLLGANLTGLGTTTADLTGANLKEANVTEANLAGANMAGALLSEANLAKANLSGAKLAKADLIQANLAGASLIGADLTGADLTRANLTGTNLSRANLSTANMTGANLTDADLTGANLTDATLATANVSGADLTDATLAWSNELGAGLAGTNLAKLSGICGDSQTKLPLRLITLIPCPTPHFDVEPRASLQPGLDPTFVLPNTK